MSSLYLHIPFCLSKCPYCSFSSFQGQEELYERYCDALIADITRGYSYSDTIGLETLYIGGGTPTVLSGEQIGKIITSCRDTYGLAASAEVSIEANPGTIDLQALEDLRSKGVNRLSLGVQSFDDDELQFLGRIYRCEEIYQVVEYARKAGFENISLDLMYGLPGQSLDGWKSNLEQGLNLLPTHLSLYQLTIEEGTPFFERVKYKKMILPDEDLVLQVDEITEQCCREAGFLQYEISNFCRPGYQCRHNLVYWRNEQYLAAGAGAVGYYEGIRSRNIADPIDYCLAVEEKRSFVEESEKLDREASFRESVVMGLRLTWGVEQGRLLERFGYGLAEVYGRTLVDLIHNGLLEMDSGVLRLTYRGRRLANMVMAELV